MSLIARHSIRYCVWPIDNPPARYPNKSRPEFNRTRRYVKILYSRRIPDGTVGVRSEPLSCPDGTVGSRGSNFDFIHPVKLFRTDEVDLTG